MKQDAPKPSLPYEQPSGITRRAFRLLLILTFINTILLGTSLMGPQTYQQAIKIYRDWQSRRIAAATRAKAQAQLSAKVSQARSFAFPEGYVAYTEDQGEAIELLHGGKRYQSRFVDSAPPGWQAPVEAVDPAQMGKDGRVFLHERKAPGGVSMLVSVHVQSTFAFAKEGILKREGQFWDYSLAKDRRLNATVWNITPDRQLGDPHTAELVLLLPDNDAQHVARHRAGEKPENLTFGHTLRFLAGRPDANDAARFTIDFTLDGRAGTIDGWLTENDVVLRPRQGAALGSAGPPAWDLLARGVTPATTQAVGAIRKP